MFRRNAILQAWCWTRVCHEQGKKWLISGFKSHLARSHQQGWFNSVNNKASGFRLHVSPWKKKGKKGCFWSRSYLELNIRLLLHTDHAERWGIFLFWHLQWRGKLPSGKWSYRYYLRSSHTSAVHPSGMRIWTSLALCSLSRYYSFKSRLLWMQTGSQADTASNRVALSRLN